MPGSAVVGISRRLFSSFPNSIWERTCGGNSIADPVAALVRAWPPPYGGGYIARNGISRGARDVPKCNLGTRDQGQDGV